jgi:hypothetical protein
MGMPGSGRIIYNLPRASGPAGGIKVMLGHVEVLRAALVALFERLQPSG